MKLLNYLIFGLLTIFLLLTYSSNVSVATVSDDLSYPVGESGSFYLSNTTNRELLFSGYYQATIKDIYWNLIISIDSNSSSGLSFSLYDPIGMSTVQGEKQFTVEPGETLTLSYKHEYIYYSVTCSCEAPPINFYYSLADVSQQTSGNFELYNDEYIQTNSTANTTSPRINSSSSSDFLEEQTSEHLTSSHLTSEEVGGFELVAVIMTLTGTTLWIVKKKSK